MEYVFAPLMESTRILLSSIDSSVRRLGDIMLGETVESDSGAGEVGEGDVVVPRSTFEKINRLRLEDPPAYKRIVQTSRSAG